MGLTAVFSIPMIAVAAPDLSQYSLVFEDEFKGTELDPEIWQTGLLWGPYEPINNEEQIYVDILGINADYPHSPFLFTGSSLKIVATETSPMLQPPLRPDEDDPIWQNFHEYRYNGADESNGELGYQSSDVNYLSGVITSYDSFRFTHGYAETRIKVPAGQGLWPAFWLSTSFYVEDVPEIDIVENLGQDTNTVYHTYHYFEPDNDWALISTPSYTTTGVDFSSDWHTFGVLWGPKEIVWYVDGVETRRITDDEYSIPNQAMYLIANLAVGGNWPGSPTGTTQFPAEFEIDYIKAYQKIVPETITPEVLASDYQLMFSDEFEGNVLNTNKWNTSHLWGPFWQINEEDQFYPDISGIHADFPQNPISQSDGTLKITAEPIAAASLPPLPSLEDPIFDEEPEWRHSLAYNTSDYTNPPVGSSTFDASLASEPFLPEYTSGILTSYDSFKFVNGYAEIRAKLPAGDGLWPAFWLLNGYYVDEQPEIDIVEARGEALTELVHSYHYYDPFGQIHSESYSTTGATNYTEGFHTYGVSWKPGQLDWYVDGVLQHTYTSPTVSSQNMYAILNLAVGGNFNWADVDPNAFPATLEVDYVRIYQINTNSDLGGGSGDAVIEAAVRSVLAGLESYAEENGTYIVSGGGFGGLGQGYFHYNNSSKYPESLANILVVGGHLVAPAPIEPNLSNPGISYQNDFMVYRCEDRIAVFAVSSTAVPSDADALWWSQNSCQSSPIDSYGREYFAVSAPL